MAGRDAPHDVMRCSAPIFLLLFPSRKVFFRLESINPAPLKTEPELTIGAERERERVVHSLNELQPQVPENCQAWSAGL